MTARRDSMSGLSLDQKKKLLAELLKQSGQTAPRVFPLAAGQKALWLIHQQAPDNASYNTPFALRIRSEVNAAALKGSFETIAGRHPSLRTTFSANPDGQLIQIVHRKPQPQFAIHDATGWTPDQLDEAVTRAYRQPFSLERGPLFRGDLFSVAPDDHILLITIHHIVYDGWSAGILQRELSQTYLALSTNGQPELPPVTGNYSDFVARQNELLVSPRGRVQWEYWQKKLSGELPVLTLPADRARTGRSENKSGACPITLDATLTAAVKALAQREDTTPFVVMLSAYAALLSRLARQDEVIIGSPTTGRSGPDFHDVVGYFANPVAIRAELSGAPSTTTLIARLRTVVHEALAHQEFPLASIVERLALERRPGESPIFQAAMTFQSSRDGADAMDLWAAPGEESRVRWGDVELEPYPLKDQEGQFDLTFEVWEARGAFAGALRYDRDLFDDATVRLWRGYFEKLLGEMVRAPDTPIASLALGENETAPVTSAVSVASRAPTITSWFEEQVARTPSARALSFNDLEINYAELNARANVLAHQLIERGVGPEVLVGVCVDRTAELVIAILAVLKAGGAYVPLDPASPRDRLALILDDADVKALITETKRAHELPTDRVATIFVDAVRWDDPRGGENPQPEITPDNAAYVIYTSGSTGRPKGVIVTHANVTRLFTTTEPLYDFGPSDVWTLFHSAAFDFSVWELWGAFFYGGRLIVIPHWMTRSPEAFAELLVREGVTVLNQTPSAFRALMRAPAIADGVGGRAIRYVIFGGEALDAATIRPWLEKYSGGGQLINMYGITETTVHVTFHRVTEADLGASASPIGRPIPDLEIRLLDEQQNPVPVGVPGEICVGGPGVARGYLKRPELTAQRFISDPLAPGQKLYRSGDLALRRADGTFDYLGRMDDQVKIRGFRIELGEIQSLIAEHPAVAEAHVAIYERSQDDKRIVAYVVPKEGASELVLSTPAHVGEWTELYDEIYARSACEQQTDPLFNIAGWNSSYTGAPLSAEAMREWVDHTASQILARKPATVLEIGCGTGLMLTRIAPSTTAYWGTDISKVVVGLVGTYCAQAGLDQVKLFHKAADQLDEIDFGGQRFDAVIINSVVQYFPSSEYLARALASAAKYVNKGGFIFVGDVRNYRLLEAFHASVALAQVSGAVDPTAFEERVARRMAGEEELVLHPDFFWTLRELIPRISHVEVRPKRGVCLNELTRFRYDVLLHLEVEASADAEPSWGPGDLTLPEIRTRLSRETAPRIGLRGIRNARLQPAAEAAELLHADTRALSVSIERLKARVLDRDGSVPPSEPEVGIDPEALHQLADAMSLEVALDWSRGGADGSFDAVFLPKGVGPGRPISFSAAPTDARSSRIANDPLRGRLERRLESELRKNAQDRLPEYMVPASIMVIDRLPLTENGKVDRRALPVPVGPHHLDVAHVDPRTGEEEILASIFSELLGAERVGVYDSFFELGGHSLLATQVVSRIRTVFGVDLPLRALFDSPTVAGLALAVTTLRAGPSGGAAVIELGVTAPRPDEIPLSHAQERMWILDRVEETRAPIYVIPLVMRLRGSLDRGALEKSLRLIVDRHEVLRTSFPMRGERAVQMIAEDAVAELPPTQDLPHAAGISEVELRSIIEEHAGVEVSRPFDLARGPLVRMRLFRIADADHVLVLTLHHIISDGWSMGVIARELSAAYNAIHAGRDPAFPALSIQYADVAMWQRRLLEEGALSAAIDAAKTRLLGGSPFLDLPTDHARPAAPSFTGGVVRFAIDRALTTRLKALSRREGVTLYMTLLGAFAAYLSRISNQKDLILGSPVANRNRALTEPLVGLFVNTLALRFDLSSNPTFVELLAKVRQTTLDAYADQDVPFEKLVEAISPERSLNRQPLVQVMFVLQNAPFAPPDLEGIAVELVDLDSITAKFELTLSMQETGDGLAAHFEYSSELFDRARIEQMAEHFGRLLAAVVERPTTRVPELGFIGEEEAKQISDWSTGGTADLSLVARDDKGKALLHQRIEATAKTTPHAVALEYDGATLSYAELNARANNVAHRLIALGAKRGDLVAVAVPRSFELIVGLVGAWKAGTAYVPLDPAYPKARLDDMLQDSGAKFMLVTRATEALSATLTTTLPTLRLDDVFDGESSADPDVPIAPADAAYVIYTSGSTGRPKGVVLEHRGLANVPVLQHRALDVDASCVVLQFASINFDASVWEIALALGHGGRLVLVPSETLLAGDGLRDVLVGSAITDVVLPPTSLAALPQDNAYPALRRLVTAGESCPASIVQKWAKNGIRFFNAYGPTEATIVVTVGQCFAEDTGPVSIGRPVFGAIARILDAEGRLVPAGVYGEICAGGIGVARGYLGLDALTNERFVADPFVKGARLYKTGDVGRWRPDGTIEIAGRRDHQVKLRGYRIELGEIEAALESHPSVTQAVAIVHGNQLVAYVTGAGIDVRALRGHAASRLPDYMVPTHVIVLDALPLTLNAKIDRAKLPDPSALVERAAYVAPSTPAEEILADLFATVLHKEKVGVHDNFFALGGDSIHGLQVIGRAGQRGLKLRPRQLFEHQTVAELARVAVPDKEIDAEQGVVRGRAPLTPSQRDAHGAVAIAIDLPATVTLEQVQQALNAIELHHDVLRMRLDGADAFHLDAEPTPGPFPVDIVEGGGVRNLTPRIMRAALIRTTAGEARLELVVHAIAADAISAGILADDFKTALAGTLPPKTTSFLSWANRLAKHADSADVRAELDAWLAATERDANSLLRLDDPSASDTEEDASTIAVFLDADETRALFREVPRAYDVTIDEVLITALARAFAAFSGDPRARIDLEGPGREALFDDVDLTRTVGSFTTQFPLQVRADTRASPRETLARVKDALRRIPRGGIGFGLLRDLASDPSIRAHLAATRPAPVVFRLHRATDPQIRTLRTPGARRLHPLEIEAVVQQDAGEERLRVNWTFGSEVFRAETIERLGGAFIGNVRDLIRGRTEPAAQVQVAADFPAARLNQRDLEKVLAQTRKAAFKSP